MSLRACDANLNRLKEALRVLEDHFRFSLHENNYCNILYAMRHKATQIAAKMGAGKYRASTMDPGRHRKAKPGQHDLVTANLKRAQEACRVLEENSRLLKFRATEDWQELRFSLYELESSICRDRAVSGSLYLIITPKFCLDSPENTALKACKAGIDVIQYRDPHRSDREIIQTASGIRKITAEYGVTLIINNRPDIALMSGADGVHIGQNDLPVAEVRKFIGDSMSIGLSTHTREQMIAGLESCADYLGFGPVFSCVSKEKEEQATGLSIVKDPVFRNSSKPIFLIGGFSMENYDQAFQEGALRIVFMTGICMRKDMEKSLVNIRNKWRTCNENNRFSHSESQGSNGRFTEQS